MPSKRTILFGLAIIAATFIISNQAAKSPDGLLAKFKSLGS